MLHPCLDHIVPASRFNAEWADPFLGGWMVQEVKANRAGVRLKNLTIKEQNRGAATHVAFFVIGRNQAMSGGLSKRPAAHFPLPVLGRQSRA
jgi:hypothetical protein